MPLAISIVSAEQEVWTGEARQVSARTIEGEIGILSGHEPVLAVLGEGQVRVVKSDGVTVVIDAVGGFLSVDHDNVEIVARDAKLAS